MDMESVLVEIVFVNLDIKELHAKIPFALMIVVPMEFVKTLLVNATLNSLDWIVV